MKKIVLSLLAITLTFFACDQPRPENINGMAIGTYYNITYIGTPNAQLKTGIDSIFKEITYLFSVFDTTSIISQVNRNESPALPPEFITLFQKAKIINGLTEGAFEPTIYPLINLWGFGNDQPSQLPTTIQIDSVKEWVGMDKLYIENGQIHKKDPRVQLDFNAIAKGYAADQIAAYLSSQGYQNFVVEVGGEVICRGDKGRRQPWRVGIQVPTDTKNGTIESDYTFPLANKSIATSGNYRNYIEENQQRYSHIINPQTGQPEKSNLLSVSVIANDCTTADALATALMVLGIEKSQEILQKDTSIAAHFIYFEKGNYQYYQTKNFPKAE